MNAETFILSLCSILKKNHIVFDMLKKIKICTVIHQVEGIINKKNCISTNGILLILTYVNCIY
jgi:hypothetical protein